MEKLSFEEKEYITDILRKYHKAYKDSTLGEIIKESEYQREQLLKTEVRLLALEKIAHTHRGGECVNWVPLPLRKAVEAMQIVFPRYKKDAIRF